MSNKTKTHKGLTKRVKVTATGKVLRRKSFTGHLLSSRPSKRRRRLRHATVMFKTDAVRMRRAMNA